MNEVACWWCVVAADLFEAYKQQYCSDQVNALKQAFNTGKKIACICRLAHQFISTRRLSSFRVCLPISSVMWFVCDSSVVAQNDNDTARATYVF